jgi:hypothetical protein
LREKKNYKKRNLCVGKKKMQTADVGRNKVIQDYKQHKRLINSEVNRGIRRKLKETRIGGEIIIFIKLKLRKNNKKNNKHLENSKIEY